MDIAAQALTDIGRKKGSNEDTFLIDTRASVNPIGPAILIPLYA